MLYEVDKPIRDTFLPYGKQYIDEDDLRAVVETLKSDMLTTGPKIAEFEKIVTEFTGAKYGAAMANGTAALHAAVFAAGIEENDEVITSPITFAASANCVLYQGGKPVFVDIDPKTYNLDPTILEAKITSKTKAIIPVDFTGQPADMDAIKELAKKHNLVVIEDASHSIGATYKSDKVGVLADLTTVSFHPVKHITCGEGGIVLTNNSDYYQKLTMFRNHGIVRGEQMQTENAPDWFYEQQVLGFNYRLTDILAALGISQMKKIGKFIQRRREIAEKYNQAFADFELLTIPYQHPTTNSSWHLYVIRLELEKLTVGRREIYDALRKENLGVQIHYIPVYYHPYYQKLGYQKGICPIAEDCYERIITLPLFPLMSEQDVNDVIEIVYKVLNYYRK